MGSGNYCQSAIAPRLLSRTNFPYPLVNVDQLEGLMTELGRQQCVF